MSQSKPSTLTVRVRRDTHDELTRLARERRLSTPDLIGELVERARDDELFARHASAYDELRRTDPDLLRAIEAEDRAWERSALEVPVAEE